MRLIQGTYPRDFCYPQCRYIERDLDDVQILRYLREADRQDVLQEIEALGLTYHEGSEEIRKNWLNKLCVHLYDDVGIYKHDFSIHLIRIYGRG
jgi:hypothetical protein